MNSGLRHLLVIISVSLAILPATANAQASHANASPVGHWMTIDDLTGKAKSIVLIWEQNGKLFGKVQKLVNPDPKNPNPQCKDCAGTQKNKPVIGLQILQDLQKDGNGWSGGTILDPATGKIYKCLISVMDSGAKLKVRGFVGLPMFGRTQYWQRQ